MKREEIVTQALDIVAKLNEELETQDFAEAAFSVETDGRETAEIHFWAQGMGDQTIWDSRDDMREAVGVGKYEPLEEFLRKEAKERLLDAAKQHSYVKL